MATHTTPVFDINIAVLCYICTRKRIPIQQTRTVNMTAHTTPVFDIDITVTVNISK